ncbi:sodium-coupled multidrug efflux MATE transporter PdrM [Streptococcus pneumoniae]|uniref:sodium-coupled multidrug efflux MATE transporter PdrM n=1 Tax=Streptococcus pneumoniae TaxID=1313 RepID=UPI001CCBC939|nr:sodium-coupled multidrug efflux MATE transporter PdrM [Streptococcus pneumoniae]MBZ8058868.1 sodium-coupled multidrug efflux MATE transporter PdrM [Streptococcus pneumoniae]MBZ8072478.1 sodium-coupled multidrug efflux MATE transporter PdrM [Streptococcus pneumoniae]MBZ8076314.1 sodium-coupled multidrug efflux MATE transporter PdrM [Streptococcus pneumoniae]HET0807003.1 sodium-coupled multidrug efflux MATE transporter PdrM [Streptococcus pneumoniae]HET0840694.1 sodium-coupled multidrug efflu
MYKTKCLREKLVLFLKIFFPILIYQFANYSASFVDTAMTGQYNTMDLAGVSMATSIWNPFFTFLTGIVSALVPIIGHHLGRGKKEEVASDFYQFIYLALGLSVVLLGMVLFLAPTILNHIGLEAAVAAVAVRYLWFLSIGIIPLLLFSVIRSLLDSLGLTKLSMYLMLLLLPLNSGFNYLLIYGAFGVPELGGAGAGLGTSLAYWVLLGISVLVLFKQEKLKALHLEKRIPLNMDKIKEGVRLGLPIGGTIFAEVAVFSVVGLIMAKFSSLIIASHQSAMNFSSLMYAFPMSISSAMAIVVSYEVGAKRFDDAKTYIGLGRWTALIFAAFTLTFLYIFRGNVASIYGNDPKFIDLTARFLTYSLFFQLADTFAAPLQGILRGYKDTVIPFYLGLLGYWGVAIPVATLFDSLTDFGAYSYWIGLIISLIVSGALYRWRLTVIMKRFESLAKFKC